MPSRDCGWKRLFKDFKKGSWKTKPHYVWVINRPLNPLPRRPSLKPHVPKEVFGSFEVSHIVVNKVRIIWFKKVNIFLYIRAFWQHLVVNWIQTGRNSAVQPPKWSRPRNDPQSWNDPQIDPEMIPISLHVDPEMNSNKFLEWNLYSVTQLLQICCSVYVLKPPLTFRYKLKTLQSRTVCSLLPFPWDPARAST